MQSFVNKRYKLTDGHINELQKYSFWFFTVNFVCMSSYWGVQIKQSSKGIYIDRKKTVNLKRNGCIIWRFYCESCMKRSLESEH